MKNTPKKQPVLNITKQANFEEQLKTLQAAAPTNKEGQALKNILVSQLKAVAQPKAAPAPVAPAAKPTPKQRNLKKDKAAPKLAQDLVFRATHTFTSINNLADNLGEVIEQTRFYSQAEKAIAKRVHADCLKLQELKFSQVLDGNAVTAQYVLIEENYLDIQDSIGRLNSFEQAVLRQIILEVFFSKEKVDTLDIKKLVSLVNTISEKATSQAKSLDRLNNLKKARQAKALKNKKTQ